MPIFGKDKPMTTKWTQIEFDGERTIVGTTDLLGRFDQKSEPLTIDQAWDDLQEQVCESCGRSAYSWVKLGDSYYHLNVLDCAVKNKILGSGLGTAARPNYQASTYKKSSQLPEFKVIA
jgi:hypothetical protein